MKELLFATTNTGKVASLQRMFDQAGMAVKVVPKAFDLIEEQADDALQVAESKARQAFALAGEPLVVDDSAFHIPALGGFPGAYQKYVIDTIGPEGILKLMEGIEDRSAYFISNLVYVDATGKLASFSDSKYRGRVATEYNPTGKYEWGITGKLFIPEGSDVVGTELSPEERYELGKQAGFEDAYELFVEWYKRHSDS